MNKKINALKFKLSVLKVKRAHWKAVKYRLKVLNFCIRHLDRICIPTSDAKNEAMKLLLSTYDETIENLNKSVDIYRKRVYQDDREDS